MGFLLIPCIEPVSTFIGCVPLSWSMIFMACVILAIAGYTYFEATVYFEDMAAFGFISKGAYAIIEGAIALLLIVTFLIEKRNFTLLMYLITFALAGFGLAINVQKLSLLDLEKEVKNDGERRFLEWLYFIRIGAEFMTEMMVCYVVYSLKKKE